MSGPPPRGANGMGLLPAWADLEPAVPQVTATMRRYLTQIGCVLRPGSVNGIDLGLRCFAGFLADTAPEVTRVAQVTRRHIEDYKPWLARRPGQNKPRLTTATITHRLGTLRMFFVRIDEWGWDEAPPRVPMFPGDLPRGDHPLPKALDDAAAAKLLRAAQNDQRLGARDRGDAAAHRAVGWEEVRLANVAVREPGRWRLRLPFAKRFVRKLRRRSACPNTID